MSSPINKVEDDKKKKSEPEVPTIDADYFLPQKEGGPSRLYGAGANFPLIFNTYTFDGVTRSVSIHKFDSGRLDFAETQGSDGITVYVNDHVRVSTKDCCSSTYIDSEELTATIGHAYEEMLKGKITPGEAKKLEAAQKLLLGSCKEVDAERHLNPAAEQKIIQAYKDLTAEALKDPSRGR